MSSLDEDERDTTLYDCNSSTKICTERPGCTPYTYLYDSENRKALFCNENERLKHAEFTGYVVDSSQSIGLNHPYLIKCEANGKRCMVGRPKTDCYYENNGYDSETNRLIQCSNNNCVPVEAEVGYYVGHDGAGIIHCTSPTTCVYSQVRSNVKYVNVGADKIIYPIIECDKHKGCSAIRANVGYYLTYSNAVLIHCPNLRECEEIVPTVNYYENADAKGMGDGLINCVENGSVVSCAFEPSNNGFYISSVSNVLIRCTTGSKCHSFTVRNGIFRGALRGLTGGGHKRSEDDTTNEPKMEVKDEELEGKQVVLPSRDSDEAYGIIRCIAGKCSVLSAEGVASIPMCEFNNNKCYITLDYAMTKSATTSIAPGNICTNNDRSIFYFATDTIVIKPDVIAGVTSTYVYTTTNTNCLEVNDSYTDRYFTVGSNIYLLDQGSVLQFYEPGYYFINNAKNTLVTSNDITDYNDENVKLYHCNGNMCQIIDTTSTQLYFTDINKRIMTYNANHGSFTFAYDKDIICIFDNNKCTPNADMNNREFCITYKGEIALVRKSIKNRETGECFKAPNINNSIYGYGQSLYSMSIYSAELIETTGYYIVNLSTNSTIQNKQYHGKNNNIVIYGCQHSSCEIYEPDEDVYYYDERAKTLLRYKDGIWKTPDTSGNAMISVDPTTKYIYNFTKDQGKIILKGPVTYGYHYTVDGEMYHCSKDGDNNCELIEDSGYYFTNTGEVYYCVYDSEELEPTECTRKSCVSGQFYYINETYYRCESSYILTPVKSRHCSMNEKVIVNFPVGLTEEYPEKIQQAIDGIAKNNNSTAIIRRRGRNYLDSVSSIFTNCTYDAEETRTTLDLVCVNNYVTVDEETKSIKICSLEKLGYVECMEDSENPEKCHVSAGLLRFFLPSLFTTILFTVLMSFLNLIF